MVIKIYVSGNSGNKEVSKMLIGNRDKNEITISLFNQFSWLKGKLYRLEIKIRHEVEHWTNNFNVSLNCFLSKNNLNIHYATNANLQNIPSYVHIRLEYKISNTISLNNSLPLSCSYISKILLIYKIIKLN